MQGPSQENNLCSCLGEATERFGGRGNGFPKLRQVSILGVLGDAGHGLAQYLRNRVSGELAPVLRAGEESCR